MRQIAKHIVMQVACKLVCRADLDIFPRPAGSSGKGRINGMDASAGQELAPNLWFADAGGQSTGTID